MEGGREGGRAGSWRERREGGRDKEMKVRTDLSTVTILIQYCTRTPLGSIH